ADDAERTWPRVDDKRLRLSGRDVTAVDLLGDGAADADRAVAAWRGELLDARGAFRVHGPDPRRERLTRPRAARRVVQRGHGDRDKHDRRPPVDYGARNAEPVRPLIVSGQPDQVLGHRGHHPERVSRDTDSAHRRPPFGRHPRSGAGTRAYFASLSKTLWHPRWFDFPPPGFLRVLCPSTGGATPSARGRAATARTFECRAPPVQIRPSLA